MKVPKLPIWAGRLATAYELQIGPVWFRWPKLAYLRVGRRPFVRIVRDWREPKP